MYHHELYDEQDRAQGKIAKLETEVLDLCTGGGHGDHEDEGGEDESSNRAHAHGSAERFRPDHDRDQSEDAEAGGITHYL